MLLHVLVVEVVHDLVVPGKLICCSKFGFLAMEASRRWGRLGHGLLPMASFLVERDLSFFTAIVVVDVE